MNVVCASDAGWASSGIDFDLEILTLEHIRDGVGAWKWLQTETPLNLHLLLFLSSDWAFTLSHHMNDIWFERKIINNSISLVCFANYNLLEGA